VKNLAYEYAMTNGISGFSKKKKNAGYYWFRGFIRRHKDLVIKKAENLSVPRAMCMNRQLMMTNPGKRITEYDVAALFNTTCPYTLAMCMNRQQITNWFNEYENVVTRLGINDLPRHLWNVDETGCQNIHKADDVVGVVAKPSYNLTALEQGKTSTALIAINAVGNAAPPMIIHKGKYLGKDWKNGVPQDTLVRVSDKGYINKELFVEFGKLFIAYLKRQELMDGRRHLLLLDCHYSHLYNISRLPIFSLI